MDRLPIIMTAFSIALIVVILVSVRREHIRVESSVSWLGAAVVLLLLTSSRAMLSWISGIIGAGDGVLLPQRLDVGVELEVLGVDARRGRVQVAAHPVDPGGVEAVQVDQRVVAQDRAVVGRDEAHAAHVGGQRVGLVDAGERLQARKGRCTAPASRVVSDC